MAYADYLYYTESYHGTAISEEEWPLFSERAGDYLDYITQGRAEAHAELPQVKKAACELAERYQLIERSERAAASEGGELASQTVGSWSATYRSGAERAEEYRRQLYAVARQRLAHTGLLSRGGGCGRCTCPTP